MENVFYALIKMGADELIFSLLPLVIVIPVVESYLYARKIEKPNFRRDVRE